MSTIVSEQQLETYRNKVRILEHELSACADVYYNINLTQNLIPGKMYQVIDNVEYNINEMIGFPEGCKYQDVIEYWGEQLENEQQAGYHTFFDCNHLTQCFENGEEHVSYRFRTKNLLRRPMLAEQHVIMYRDLQTGDLLAITYIFDRTKMEELHAREEEQRKRLEEDIIRIEGLASRYSSLYYMDFETKECIVYNLNDKVPQEIIEKNIKTMDAFFEVYRKTVVTYTHPDYQEEMIRYADEQYVREILRGKKRHSCRFLHMGENGEFQWMELMLIKFAGKEDEITNIAYGFLNVDEEEREKENQRKALLDALAAAEHANRAKTAFLNNMSHDIRTPMNAIIGYAALAASHLDNPEVTKDYLRKISISSDHLLSLINDVLDMSRIESGWVKIEEKEVHLPDVLHDLRTIIQSNIAAKQQDLFIDTQDIVHEDIITDKLRLNQVLLNIVSNAIKLTPVGGKISIRVSEKESESSERAVFEFRIRDNGIGMSREFQEHIFESFTRERTATVSGIQGTGLGMAITKNILDMMGGTIRVISEEGKGSEFIVTLTCRLFDTDVKYEPIPKLEGARAPVVDDDTDTCMSVSKMLKQLGLRTDWTVSGREALVRVKEANEEKDSFSVFIIDWLMPDMNGVETVRRIRKLVGKEVSIIILTAYDWSDIEAEAREAGVTAFAMKPLFMSELWAMLTRHVRVEAEQRESGDILDFQGKKILLVEDNELNQEIAVEILQDAGFVVDVANDGIVALERMKTTPAGSYDLILMDVQMPRMDGFAATREIRSLENPEKARIPIFAMTANAFEEDKQQAYEAGMDGFIAKPININRMLRTLADTLKYSVER